MKQVRGGLSVAKAVAAEALPTGGETPARLFILPSHPCLPPLVPGSVLFDQDQPGPAYPLTVSPRAGGDPLEGSGRLETLREGFQSGKVTRVWCSAKCS